MNHPTAQTAPDEAIATPRAPSCVLRSPGGSNAFSHSRRPPRTEGTLSLVETYEHYTPIHAYVYPLRSTWELTIGHGAR